MTQLHFSKVLNVNSPFKKNLDDAGWDMYIPKIDDNLIELILKSNPKWKSLGHKPNIPIHTLTTEYQYCEFDGILFIDEHGHESLILTDDGHYVILKPINIPSGIQFLLPDGYYGELCSRSSNFKNNFNIITGRIDNPYTFNCGFQINLVNPFHFAIVEENTRIGQLILRHNIVNFEMSEIDLDEFENNIEVDNKRNKRTGGFGSTGNT